MARDNKLLGVFHLIGIPAAPRGMPQIEVTFDIDANGILNVSAKDLGTGKEQKITITSSSGLKKDEIDRMVSDAEKHAEEDRKRREEIEARNRLDSLVYSTEKTFNENRDKLDSSDAATFESALADAKKALEAGTSAEAMNEAAQRLQDVSHRLAEAIYKGSASAGTGGAPPPPGSGETGAPGSGAAEDEVIDTEYVDTEKN